MASLEQLPTEILQEVLSYTSPKETLTIAKVCKRLNGLALLHFFRDSFDIREPLQAFSGMVTCGMYPHRLKTVELSRSQRKSINAFSGLSILFSIPLASIDTFTISMQTCSHDDHLPHVTERYHQLVALVKRLSHVRKASFTFNYLDYSVSRSGYAKDSLKHRKDVTAELLNTILESGCEELTLSRSTFIPQQTGSSTTRFLTGFQKLQSLVVGSLEGPDRAMAPYLFGGDPVKLPASVRQSCKLQKLEISGIMLLLPPFSYWTYCVLETPSLTSLILHYIGLLQSEWEVILSWLHYPLRHRLLELDISHCHTLPVQALADFLSELENITHFQLVVANPDPVIQPKNPNHTVFFPKLVSITAPVFWISFLCPETVPRPTLRYININCLPRFEYHKTIGGLRALLNPSFSSRTSSANPEQSAPHEVEIVLDARPGYDERGIRGDFLYSRNPTNRRSGFEAYDRVTALWYDFRAVPVDNLEMFCQYLGLWKRLQVVRIITPTSQLLHSLTPGSIRSLLNAAKIHCPRVQKFVIHEKDYFVQGG